MVTPTMRCSTSVTERSGGAPMSDATIESNDFVRALLDLLGRLQRGALAADDDGFDLSRPLWGRCRLRQGKSAPQQGSLRGGDGNGGPLESHLMSPGWEWNGAESRGLSGTGARGPGVGSRRGGDGADVPLHQVNPRQAEGWFAEVAALDGRSRAAKLSICDMPDQSRFSPNPYES